MHIVTSLQQVEEIRFSDGHPPKQGPWIGGGLATQHSLEEN